MAPEEREAAWDVDMQLSHLLICQQPGLHDTWGDGVQTDIVGELFPRCPWLGMGQGCRPACAMSGVGSSVLMFRHCSAVITVGEEGPGGY